MKIHQRFKPRAFFFIGLLIGLGYVCASYFLNLTVLQKTGDKITSRISEYEKIQKQYEEERLRVQELANEVQTHFSAINKVQAQYVQHYKDFQKFVHQIVQMGKHNNLTFLDYHADKAKDLKSFPGAKVFSANLSLGGSFKNIQALLKVLQTQSNFPNAITHLEIMTTKSFSSQLRLHFRFVGKLERFLNQQDNETHIAPQSFLIIDPWTTDI